MDCYHHRIIYSDNINTDIANWTEIDYEFAGPHSIASDGDIYVVDNAGCHEVLVFNSSFRRIQTIPNVGYRPHKTIYANGRFYVMSSQTQTIYCYQKLNGILVEEYHKTLPFLDNSYCRSIKIIDGYMYFVSGSNQIFVTNYISGNFEVINSYTTPNEFTGLVDIEKYNNEIYLTSMGDARYSISPNIARSASLAELSQGNFTSIYTNLSLVDSPYFMEVMDSNLYFTEVGEVRNSVLAMYGNNNLEVYHRYTGLLPGSIKRRETYPR